MQPKLTLSFSHRNLQTESAIIATPESRAFQRTWDLAGHTIREDERRWDRRTRARERERERERERKMLTETQSERERERERERVKRVKPTQSHIYSHSAVEGSSWMLRRHLSQTTSAACQPLPWSFRLGGRQEFKRQSHEESLAAPGL